MKRGNKKIVSFIISFVVMSTMIAIQAFAIVFPPYSGPHKNFENKTISDTAYTDLVTPFYYSIDYAACACVIDKKSIPGYSTGNPELRITCSGYISPVLTFTSSDISSQTLQFFDSPNKGYKQYYFDGSCSIGKAIISGQYRYM